MAVTFRAAGRVAATAVMHKDYITHNVYSDTAERQRKRREGMKPDIESSNPQLTNL